MRVNSLCFIWFLLLGALVFPAGCHAAEVGEPGQGCLRGMNVVLLGDSNTWLGGDECTDPRGWSYWLRQIAQPAEIRSFARSGATWSHTSRTLPDTEEYSEILSDNNVIYNQVLRLQEVCAGGRQSAPDLILILAGTNDAWFPQYRPMEFSLTAAQAASVDPAELRGKHPAKIESLGEAVRYDLMLLRESFPDARVVVLTPFESIKVSEQMLWDVSEIIEAAARAEGVEMVIRLDQLSPIKSANEAIARRYTSDGTHTSEAGAKAHAEIVSRALCGLQAKAPRDGVSDVNPQNVN